MKWSPSIYRSRVDRQWIDYNGHLRDAYYTLVFSHAIDALMDELGLDAACRARTDCTLYTLEMHVHYLHEVMESDDISVSTRVIASDAKRLHLGLAMNCPRHADPVALAEFMLLHVQQGSSPRSAVFPAAIQQRLEEWQASQQEAPAASPGSRRMELGRR
jgi:acyl-CoA thioester hydrolase